MSMPSKLAFRPTSPGIVQDVDVKDNEHVAAGQFLYRLGPRQYQIALDNAKANLAQTALSVDAMKQDYQHMLSDAAAQQAQVDLDQTTYDRQTCCCTTARFPKLFSTRRNTRCKMTRVSSNRCKQQAATQLARLGGNPDIPTPQHPQYLQAQAQVDEAQRQLDHTVVKAPFAGTVTSVPSIAPGKYLSASTTAFYLVDTDHVWISANPKETELTYVRPGQQVTVAVDTYPEVAVAWHGREHQPGGVAGVLLVAGAKHQRQLGQGRAARADARARRLERQN